jgi:hypothetical protein
MKRQWIRPRWDFVFGEIEIIHHGFHVNWIIFVQPYMAAVWIIFSEVVAEENFEKIGVSVQNETVYIVCFGAVDDFEVAVEVSDLWKLLLESFGCPARAWSKEYHSSAMSR